MGATGENAQISFCIQDAETPKLVPENPVFTVIPFDLEAGDSLKSALKTKESTVPKPDGGVGDPSVIGLDVTGGIPIPFSPLFSGPEDPLIKAGMYAAEWNKIHSANKKLDLSGATYNQSTGALDLSGMATTPDQIKNKQKVKITGTTSTDGIFTLTGPDDGSSFVLNPKPALAESIAAGTICGEMIRNGKTETPVVFQAHQDDIDLRDYFIGCKPNSVDYSFEVESEMKYTYNIQGMGGELKTNNEQYSGESLVTPTQYKVFTTATDAGTISINGVGQVAGCLVQSVSWSMTRELTERKGVFVLGACGLDPGKAGLTGTISIGFEDSQFYEWLRDSTPFSLDLAIPGDEGLSYAFCIPRALLTDNDAPRKTGSIIQTANFTGSYNDDYKCRFQVDRFDER